MATAAHPLSDPRELANPNVVKVVLDGAGYALYFSRAPIPWWRDGRASGASSVPMPRPLRHIGIYAYRAGFLDAFTRLPPGILERFEALEQLRALAHGYRIAVEVARRAPHPGVDTPADLRRVRRMFK